MKTVLALALPLLFAGCASDVSPEDRDFFYHGWKHPEQSSRERMYGRNQADYFNPDDTARPTTPEPILKNRTGYF